LCLYLSITLLKKVREDLLAAGWQDESSIVVVHKASWPDEQKIIHVPFGMLSLPLLGKALNFYITLCCS
jgi:precorrin-4/cobalt-precorrin-4 C11-methyltransferase